MAVIVLFLFYSDLKSLWEVFPVLTCLSHPECTGIKDRHQHGAQGHISADSHQGQKLHCQVGHHGDLDIQVRLCMFYYKRLSDHIQPVLVSSTILVDFFSVSLFYVSGRQYNTIHRIIHSLYLLNEGSIETVETDSNLNIFYYRNSKSDFNHGLKRADCCYYTAATCILV